MSSINFLASLLWNRQSHTMHHRQAKSVMCTPPCDVDWAWAIVSFCSSFCISSFYCLSSVTIHFKYSSMNYCSLRHPCWCMRSKESRGLKNRDIQLLLGVNKAQLELVITIEISFYLFPLFLRTSWFGIDLVAFLKVIVWRVGYRSLEYPWR